MTTTADLTRTVMAAIEHKPDDTTWEALVVAAARLGRALAEFDSALTAYKNAHPYQRPRKGTTK